MILMTDNEFDLVWQGIVARTEQLAAAAKRWGLIGNWGDQNDIVILVDPPATLAEVEAAEKAIGEPLPQPLRQLFMRGSKAMEIMWSWPGALVEQPGGWAEVELHNPPQVDPAFEGGFMAWSLANVVALHADWTEACDDLTKRIAAEPDEAEFHRFFSDFWVRGFPFMTATNGDVITLDRTRRDGALLLHNHECADPVGWFLGHGPASFIEQFAAVGFLSIDYDTISTLRYQAGCDADWFAPGEFAAVDSDWLPTSHIIDARSEAAMRWSRFFFGSAH
jgi:cell wall assembly regulator SMI1